MHELTDAIALVTIPDLSLLHHRLSIPDFRFLNADYFLFLTVGFRLVFSKVFWTIENAPQLNFKVQNEQKRISRTFKALKKDSKSSKALEDTYKPSLIDLKGMYSILPLGPTLVRITWLNSRISSAQTEVSLLVFTTTLRIISTVPLAARTEALFPKGINT